MVLFPRTLLDRDFRHRLVTGIRSGRLCLRFTVRDCLTSWKGIFWRGISQFCLSSTSAISEEVLIRHIIIKNPTINTYIYFSEELSEFPVVWEEAFK